MAHVNENYNKLPGNYLFQTIAKKVADYEKKTDRQVIRLGIGDVTKPLAPAIIEALHKAVDDMATAPNRGMIFSVMPSLRAIMKPAE